MENVQICVGAGSAAKNIETDVAASEIAVLSLTVGIDFLAGALAPDAFDIPGGCGTVGHLRFEFAESSEDGGHAGSLLSIASSDPIHLEGRK